jgi:hypothetical protein
VSLLHERQQVTLHTHERLKVLCDQLLRDGPLELSLQEKRILLWDADAMQTLHRRLWSSPAEHWHKWWREAFHNYLESLSNNGKN